MLGHDGQKIVVPTFAGNALQSLKGMEVAPDESPEALAMGELDVEHPAVTIDQTESVELPLVTGIVQGAEVAPVDLEALSGTGLHPYEGAGWMQRAPQFADVGPHDGNPAVIPKRT